MLNLVQVCILAKPVAIYLLVAVTSGFACRAVLVQSVVVVCDCLLELLLTVVRRIGQHPTISQFRHNLVDLRLAE